MEITDLVAKFKPLFDGALKNPRYRRPVDHPKSCVSGLGFVQRGNPRVRTGDQNGTGAERFLD
jgi:hypothetical protein